VSGAVLGAVSTLLLIVSFPRDALLRQWFWGPHNLGATICAAALVASLILCATSLWRGNARVQIDRDGITLLDVEQRQTCRWDEVAELYETNLFSIQPNAYDLLTGWARGELHMLTLVDKGGRRLELKNVVNGFPALVALVKRATLIRLLPAAQATFSDGEPMTFGPITIDRQEVRLGNARLPWAEVESVTVSGGDVKIRPRGKFFSWCAGNLGQVPNAHVLLALARERLEPHKEAATLDRRQGAAEPVAPADPPGECDDSPSTAAPE
jgi:hypothetical protein